MNTNEANEVPVNNEKFIGEKMLNGIQKGAPFIVNGKFIGVPFNLEQVISRYGKNIIPSELGIYHLFYNDQLVYIGMSKSIRNRLLQHLKDEDMPFNNVLWFVSKMWNENATIAETLELEYKMIKKFMPVLNSRGTTCH